MVDPTQHRLGDMKDAITNIRELLDGKNFDAPQADKFARATFERYLAIDEQPRRRTRRSAFPRHDAHGCCVIFVSYFAPASLGCSTRRRRFSKLRPVDRASGTGLFCR